MLHICYFVVSTTNLGCALPMLSAYLRPTCSHFVSFPSAEGLDLLRKMLTFNPKKRITVAKALESPFFQGIECHENAGEAPYVVRLPFDDWKDMNESELRLALLKEAQKFHPELVIPL